MPTREKIRVYRKRHRDRYPDERLDERRAYYQRSDPGERRPWTMRELTAITRPNRPSDEALSFRLRRSKLAIQIMRCRAAK